MGDGLVEEKRAVGGYSTVFQTFTSLSISLLYPYLHLPFIQPNLSINISTSKQARKFQKSPSQQMNPVFELPFTQISLPNPQTYIQTIQTTHQPSPSPSKSRTSASPIPSTTLIPLPQSESRNSYSKADIYPPSPFHFPFQVARIS
jgi:hypothetical protein